MARKRSDELHAAIMVLASKIEFGVLMADTTPAAFLLACADEIDRLCAIEKLVTATSEDTEH